MVKQMKSKINVEVKDEYGVSVTFHGPRQENKKLQMVVYEIVNRSALLEASVDSLKSSFMMVNETYRLK